MNTTTLPSIPVSPDTAARFASLDEEQKRIVRMRVAIEIARLLKPGSRARTVEGKYRAVAAAIGNRGRRRGLTLARARRMIDASR